MSSILVFFNRLKHSSLISRSVRSRQILFFQRAGQIDEIAGGLPSGFAAAQPMAGAAVSKSDCFSFASNDISYPLLSEIIIREQTGFAYKQFARCVVISDKFRRAEKAAENRGRQICYEIMKMRNGSLQGSEGIPQQSGWRPRRHWRR